MQAPGVWVRAARCGGFGSDRIRWLSVRVLARVVGCLLRGDRVLGQNLPIAISDTNKTTGRSPRTVASATIQERS